MLLDIVTESRADDTVHVKKTIQLYNNYAVIHHGLATHIQYYYITSYAYSEF